MTIKMLAPKANQSFNCSISGNTYISDLNSVISSVASQDVNALESMGCAMMPNLQVKDNVAATTNPGVSDDSGDGYGVGSMWVNTSTGVVYFCTSATLGAASWSAGAAGVLGLPWVTGRFYGLPPGATQAAVLTVLGTIYAYPISIPNNVTLDSLNVSVTSGQTGGKARGALFYDSAGYPGAIVAGSDTGDLAATGTAVATKGSLALALAAGRYWYGSIYTASSTMPSVIGATATYADVQNAAIGAGSAADALATSAKAVTGIFKTGQTYPATDMATSFPTFPASGSLASNVTTPIAALGV